MVISRRPSPFGELMSLRQAMDRLFEESFVRPDQWVGVDGGPVALDVTSDKDELVVRAALPGVKPEDVDITVEAGTLTINGEYREESRSEGSQQLLSEIRRGTFRRAVSLPSGLEADKAVANFENGILTLRIPRAEAVKPRQIRISPTTEASGNGTAAGAARELTSANTGA
jgi:HSP20 family protein